MSTSNETINKNKEDKNKECEPLFRAKLDPFNFEFSQFIPTIVAIGVFTYGLLMYDQTKVESENTIIDINALYILFTIGFFILFLNNIFNGDENRKKYYRDIMNNPNIKGIPWIHYLFKRFFNYKIKHLDYIIEKIPILQGTNVKYYEYPFNFSIFIGIIIIVLLDNIFKLNQSLTDNPGTDLKYKAKEDKEANPEHFFCTTSLIGIVGIVFAVLTNKFILHKTDDEVHNQENGWIARLVFYIVGFVSVVTILGSIAHINSAPIAPIKINIKIDTPSNDVLGWWLAILSAIFGLFTLYTIMKKK